MSANIDEMIHDFEKKYGVRYNDSGDSAQQLIIIKMDYTIGLLRERVKELQCRVDKLEIKL